jgi:hypothetical protein
MVERSLPARALDVVVEQMVVMATNMGLLGTRARGENRYRNLYLALTLISLTPAQGPTISFSRIPPGASRNCHSECVADSFGVQSD